MKKTMFLMFFLFLAGPLMASDAGFNISIGAPGFYLSVGDFFGYPEREVIVVHRRGIPDNDLPVVFFISQHAHVAPGVIIDLRLGSGWSWARICEHYRIPPVVFYLPVARYGPPFGHAYGHYHRHPHRGDWDRIRMTDALIVNQVNLIFITKYYNYPPERVIRMREEGSSFGTIERKVYREREYESRGGAPHQGTRDPGPPQKMGRPLTPSREFRDPQRWREEIPSQGVRPPSARFQDVYPSIPDRSQRPEVRGGYGGEDRGKGRGEGRRGRRGKD